MKEQDFIDTINKKTNDLPVPDSVSPESMKKMLDQHITKSSLASDQKVENKNRRIRRFTVAACVVLCLAGSVGVSKLLFNPNITQSDSASDSSNTGSVRYHADSDEDLADNSNDEFGDDLAYQTHLTSPASYEEYFNTIKSAYDTYYDSISTVDTYDDIEDFILEKSDSDGGISYESAAQENSALRSDAEIPTNTSGSAEESTGMAQNSSDTAKENEFSATNTQEKNVDEGDIIKTDGTYIYRMIQKYDEDKGDTSYRLTITKTDNGKLTFVTSFDLADAISADKTTSKKKQIANDYIRFQEFYLYKDKLICMYSKETYTNDSVSSDVASYIVIYDLKDKKNPKKVQTLSQSGWYESSRISNGYLYTISDYNTSSLSDIKEYKNYIPCVNDNTVECKDIYYPSNVLMESTHVVTTLDLKNPADFTDTKAIPSTGTETYVSDSAIYFYATIYDNVTKTEIMKIHYDEGKLTVGSSAVIAGYLYGPFAINEYNDHLRIIATIPANNTPLLRVFDTAVNGVDVGETTGVVEDVNALYILDDNLNLTGKITGIAPGEIIYSARFMGDTGYFVTYRNTDPLFAVNLSDPANPVIVGNLKIPGFSNYLHVYGNDTLLGIGEETDPETQEFLGIKLSMFDISDPSDLKENDKYILKNSEYSDALSDYKAIMIDPDKNIFGFSYFAYEGNVFKYYYATYAYEEKYGFIETACYEVANTTDFDTTIRGIYIGDYFYLTTDSSITGYKIGSEDMISEVRLK